MGLMNGLGGGFRHIGFFSHNWGVGRGGWSGHGLRVKSLFIFPFFRRFLRLPLCLLVFGR
jgi:hypothetical protein